MKMKRSASDAADHSGNTASNHQVADNDEDKISGNPRKLRKIDHEQEDAASLMKRGIDPRQLSSILPNSTISGVGQTQLDNADALAFRPQQGIHDDILQQQIGRNLQGTSPVTDSDITLLRSRLTENAASTSFSQSAIARERNALPVGLDQSSGVLPINALLDSLSRQISGYVVQAPVILDSQLGRSQLLPNANLGASPISGDLALLLAGRTSVGNNNIQATNSETDAILAGDQSRLLSLLQPGVQAATVSNLSLGQQRSLLTRLPAPSLNPESSLFGTNLQATQQQLLRQALLENAVDPSVGLAMASSFGRIAGDEESNVVAATRNAPLLAQQHAALRQQSHDLGAPQEVLGRGNVVGVSSQVVLYMPSDEEFLSRFQCLARRQIELFEATQDDVDAGARGRNKPIVLGQVGIRCVHCRNSPLQLRTKGAVYFPTKFDRVYQTAVNMAAMHLCNLCRHIPRPIQSELLRLKDEKLTFGVFGGGKTYWASRVRMLGVVETEDGLRFAGRGTQT